MNRFFDLARKISFKSSYKHRMGSIITYKGKVLGLGFNAAKTHPRSKTDFNQLHAELSAVLNSRREDFTGCSIFVYRELKDGTPAPSFPCTHCFKMLKALNFKEIYYTDYNEFKMEKIA